MSRFGQRTRVSTEVRTWTQQSAFSPASLSPILWLDAADTSTITASGGAVSQWNDKSGNGYNVTQSTAANQPTTGTRSQNGYNVIDFDGTNDSLNSAANAITQIRSSKIAMQFLVVKNDVVNTDMTYLAYDTGSNFDFVSGYIVGQRSQNSDFVFGDGGTGNGSASQFSANRWANNTTDPFIFMSYVSSSAGTKGAEINGTAQTLTTYDGGTLTASNFMSQGSLNHGVWLGKRSYSNIWFLNGWIGEIITFDKVLTVDETLRLTNHLKNKWGL